MIFFCKNVCIFPEIFSCELNENKNEKKEEVEMERNEKKQKNEESQKEKEERIFWIRKNWKEKIFSLEEIEEMICPGSLA